MKKSILVDDMKHCLICGRMAEKHHIFFGNSNREKSDKYGLVIPLCPDHHRNGKDAPHKNRAIDLAYKCWGQFAYEQNIGTKEDFYHDFGRYYI